MQDSHVELEAALLCTSFTLDRTDSSSVGELRGLRSVVRVDPNQRKPVEPLWLFVSLARVSHRAMIEVHVRHMTVVGADGRSHLMMPLGPRPDIRKSRHVTMDLSGCELRELGEYRVEILVNGTLMGTVRLYAEAAGT